MVYQVQRSDLKGVYDWDSALVDEASIEIDKNSGPAVLAFIQSFYDEREWLTDSNIHAIEDYLKLAFLHDVRSPQKLAGYLRTEFS